MARTITALFDTRADADAGAARLRAAGIERVDVHDRTSQADAPANEFADTTTSEDRGMWAAIKHAVLPADDRQAYEEGIRRGGFLLSADVADDVTAAAVDALEGANSVDLDARTEQWRSSGWTPLAGTDKPGEDLRPANRDAAYSGSRYRTYGYRDES